MSVSSTHKTHNDDNDDAPHNDTTQLTQLNTFNTRLEQIKHKIMTTFDTTQTYNDLPVVHIHHPSGSTLMVYLFGAHIAQWSLKNAQEVLFMSKSAVFDNSTPIRGGIPLVFPQFGGGTLPSHGFARRSVWTVHSMQENTLVLSFSDNKSTRDLWEGNKFTLLYSITLESNAITTSFQVENQGETPFDFQALLHTYFHLRDITTTKLYGLEGQSFTDKLSEDITVPCVQPNEQPLVFDKETDYIFFKAPSQVTLVGLALSQKNDKEMEKNEKEKDASCFASNAQDGTVTIDIQVNNNGSIDTHDIVVWNPWSEKSIRMGDFGDDEFHTMCCVEPGCVSKWETLTPASKWTITQTLVVVGGGGEDGVGETKL